MARLQTSIFSILILISAILGCSEGGPPLGEVSGTVTIDGKPASGVQVSFQPTEGGRGSTATTDADGYYELVFSPTRTGALVGTHTVSISGGEPGIDDAATSGGQLLETSSIPKKYLGATKSATVESGSNTYDIAFP